MKRLFYCFACFVFLSSPHSAQAEEANWPQWQGKNRDAVSTETGLLQDWPEGGPKQVWRFEDCGLGYSGPAIVGDQLFILGARNGEEQLICLQASTGKELWSTSIGSELKNDWGDGPRSTPTVDGSLVYALGGQGNLICCNVEDGQIVWSKSLLDFGGKVPNWGYSESPTIHGQKLLCTPGSSEGAIAALDKISGDLLWQTSELTDTAHYSSIVTTNHLGLEIGVQLLVSQLVGFDLDNGNVLWSIPWGGSVAVIPTPTVWKNKIFVTSGYGAGCMMVRMGEGQTAEKVYDSKLMVNHHGGVIRLAKNLFGHSDKKGWTCMDFDTGKKIWRERKKLGKGSIAYADNRFYCLSENEGEVVLIEASPEGWKEHGRFVLAPQTKVRSDRGKIWTHPVIAGGRLYLRDQDLLFSFDVQENGR